MTMNTPALSYLIGRLPRNTLAFSIGVDEQGGVVGTTLEDSLALQVIGLRGTGKSTLVRNILAQLYATNDADTLRVAFADPRGSVSGPFWSLPQTWTQEEAWQDLRTRPEETRRGPFLLFVVDEGMRFLGDHLIDLLSARRYRVGLLLTSPFPLPQIHDTLAFALSPTVARDFVAGDAQRRELRARLEREGQRGRCLVDAAFGNAGRSLITLPRLD